jgi:Thaumarchaeal output domain 1
MGLMNRPGIQGSAAIARVLVVAHDAAAAAPAYAKLMERGALCTLTSSVQDAAEKARTTPYQSILVYAREGVPETLLLLQLLKSQAVGEPNILLLVDPEKATAYAKSEGVANAMLASTIAAERIADAAGVEEYVAAPQVNLPAVTVPDRQVILALPAPLSSEILPEGVRQQRERGQTPDIVVLTDPSGINLLTSWMSAAAAAVVPIIDASGRAGHRSDASLSAMTGRGLSETIRELEPMMDRVKQLPEAYFRTKDGRAMLMARLAVRERAMKPKRDGNLKATMRFFDESAIAGAIPLAESLVRTGHMERKFFDRVHCCPTCQSARLNVREECAKCRSADIVEEPIIHHLRCGYQGPERDFKTAEDRMVCPKCRHHLEHFSVDYDKPSTLFLCNDCGHTTGDTAIGFMCLDCETPHDSEAVKTKSVFSYDLSETGREAAFNAPLDERGEGQGAEGPSVRDRLKRFAASHENLGLPYAVMMIKLDTTGEARKSAGERVWRDTVALFASILRELFNPQTEIIELGETFLVFIGNETRDKVEISLPELRTELEKNITLNLGARYDVLGPEQLGAFM